MQHNSIRMCRFKLMAGVVCVLGIPAVGFSLFAAEPPTRRSNVVAREVNGTLMSGGLTAGWFWEPEQRIKPQAKTGPDIGQKIPALEAQDQNGKAQTLETLKGKKGLVLLFVRSADW